MADGKDFLLVTVSAEDEKQADSILNRLLKKRLVVGGQKIRAPARFLWKNKIVDMDYLIVTSYTLKTNKRAIIAEVEGVSAEEVPMITFTQFDGNQKLLDWIRETLV